METDQLENELPCHVPVLETSGNNRPPVTELLNLFPLWQKNALQKLSTTSDIRPPDFFVACKGFSGKLQMLGFSRHGDAGGLPPAVDENGSF